MQSQHLIGVVRNISQSFLFQQSVKCIRLSPGVGWSIQLRLDQEVVLSKEEGMRSRLVRVLSLLGFSIAVLLSSANRLEAQQVFGRIFGTVTDATGGAVPN